MSSLNKYELVVTENAKADIQAIANYTTLQWGEEQTIVYQNNLYQTLLDIAENPTIGQVRYGVPSLLKGRKTGKHVVFYRVDAEVIYILRILHESMDHGRHLH